MALTAIVGGTGLTSLDGLTVCSNQYFSNQWGDVSAPLVQGRFADKDIVFLSRHGADYQLAPHCINYRANIQALKDSGVTKIIAINAVGGITERMDTGIICIPDQIVDYTWGRKSTFFESDMKHPIFVDFTWPYNQKTGAVIAQAAHACDIGIIADGVYGCVQGPRLETAAEIRRMERDGCDLTGMTAMPEAVLAREAGIEYSSICLVVNRAAGKTDQEITLEAMQGVLKDGMKQIRCILGKALPILD